MPVAAHTVNRLRPKSIGPHAVSSDTEAPPQSVEADTLVADNTANNNGGYGIRAVPGVTDGGSNTAQGNSGPAQCLNIACS